MSDFTCGAMCAVHIHVCAHACRSLMLTSRVSFNRSPPYSPDSWRQSLSVEHAFPHTASVAKQPALGDPCFFPLRLELEAGPPSSPDIYVS